MRLLKKMRMEALYSQKEFAQVIGISQNHYSNIENGVRRPSPEVAKRIADVLGFGNEWYRLLEIGERANKKPANAG
ncbi:helix-turn-helix transcriptional regulator [uncultured Selenomonas sp.]|uniref:helix-turn-helix domain-containing protein n=1 Tax=uncultured Selenomonas sp. TaxID=159275 RepID=UPI002675D3C2|nr:helix-turn-helix transcriptional regulator [uncultured Selenomonas sp.]